MGAEDFAPTRSRMTLLGKIQRVRHESANRKANGPQRESKGWAWSEVWCCYPQAIRGRRHSPLGCFTGGL